MLVIVPAIRIMPSLPINKDAPELIVTLLKFVVPPIVAAALVKITEPVLALKVPPLLIQAPLPPAMVKVEEPCEFKIPPLSIVRVLAATASTGNKGSLWAPAAGIMILVTSDGRPAGVQLALVFQSVVDEPFR